MAKTKTKSWPKWPRKMTEDTIRKLEDWFKSDFTDQESCAYAWISTVTYYEYYKKDKQFSNRMDSAKEYCFILAKDAVRKWLNDKDKDYALKWLSKRQNTRYTEKVDNNMNIKWEIEQKIVYLPAKEWQKKKK